MLTSIQENNIFGIAVKSFESAVKVIICLQDIVLRMHAPKEGVNSFWFVYLSREASELYFQANNYIEFDYFSEITHEISFPWKAMQKGKKLLYWKLLYLYVSI